jgi:hypothetical protein
MNCQKYQILINKYIEGDIKDAEVAELKEHTQKCASCRNQFQHIDQIDSIMKDAFVPITSAEQATESILSQIESKTSQRVSTLPFAKQMAVAASIFLTVGLLLGFSLARTTIIRQPATGATKVPMHIGKLEGIVLVKHRDSNLWEALKSDSAIYLGDTFHSTAKSGFILELENKSTLELNQNSMLVLKLYNGETQFHLEHGKLAATLESPHPPFFVSTPHGRVEALGTEFTVTVE